jgi:hypothetical protein
MTSREEVRFTVEGGIELGAWLYLPQKGSGPGPAIVKVCARLKSEPRDGKAPHDANGSH